MSSEWSRAVDRVVKLASDNTDCCRTVWMLRPPPNFAVLGWCFLFGRSSMEVLVLFLCAVWHSRCSQTDLWPCGHTVGTLHWDSFLSPGLQPHMRGCNWIWGLGKIWQQQKVCGQKYVQSQDLVNVSWFWWSSLGLHVWLYFILGSVVPDTQCTFCSVPSTTPMVPVNAVWNTLA